MFVPLSAIDYNDDDYYTTIPINVSDAFEKLIKASNETESSFGSSKSSMDLIECKPPNLPIIDFPNYSNASETRNTVDPLHLSKFEINKEPQPIVLMPEFTPCQNQQEDNTDDLKSLPERKPIVQCVTNLQHDKNTDESFVNLPPNNELKIEELDLETDPENKYLMDICNKNQWAIFEQLLRSFSKENPFPNCKNEETGETPLMLVCRENRLVILDRLLEIGVDVNARAKDGQTALHYAAKYGNYDIVKLLLSKKADANLSENIKRSLPIHFACNRTSIPTGIISILLRMTKNGRLHKDKDGSIPLMYAIENGSISAIKELLEKEADIQINIRRKESGDSALHIACRQNDFESVRILYEAGALINAQNNLGQTPLHICAFENSEIILKYLCNNKANVNILDKMDRSVLHIAAEKGSTKSVELLVDKFKSNAFARDKFGNTLLHITSFFGFEDTTLSFLKRGVPLHMPNKKGSVCLHAAAQEGHAKVVRVLLDKGANVNARNKDLYTPLHVAIKNGHPSVVETLIGYGAEVNLKGGILDESSLHIAATTEAGSKCVDMLLKSGACVSDSMKTGETVLHIVARTGNLNMLKSLLNESVCPINQCNKGNSSLHIAVENCHYSIVSELINFIRNITDKKALENFINLKNNKGETVVHFASKLEKKLLHFESEDRKIMKLLLENSGNINVETIDTKETPLHYCAMTGNSQIMSEIISFFKKEIQNCLNKQAKNGWSPLLFASDRGHHEIVSILLENNSRVDLFDEYGMTALHLACEKGHSLVAEILLSNKSFVNTKSKHGLTPLHLAAQNGYRDLVEILIKKYHAAIDAKTLNGKSALHLAAEYGQKVVCELLLFDKICNADATGLDTKGQTPMHLAAKNDHPEVVKLFLRYKPELLMTNNTDGMNCVHLAASKGSLAVIKEFMRFNKFIIHEVKNKSTGSTPLHLAIESGHMKVVNVLLNAGANPREENNDGMTALHVAAKYGHFQLLDNLQRKISLDVVSKKTGMTPLHIAAHYGQIDFVREILIKVPVDIKSKSPNDEGNKSLNTDSGLTPLHLAAQSGHENLIRLLLNYNGIEVDAATDVNGTIPLHFAAQNGHINATSLLLSKSPLQITKKDKKGRTALHLVSSHGHLEIVALLIGQGADLNDKDNLGFTPLHYAAKAGYFNLCKLLVDSGAKCQAVTNDFKIPLIFAAKFNHTNVVSYLLRNSHSTEKLMSDNKFLYDLMICSKLNDFKSIEEFVLFSSAPAETAAKLSKLFTSLSEKEKERSKDLLIIAEYCEGMCTDLVALAAYDKGADKLLKSYDKQGIQFLDILIETEQKEVISHPSVQQYMSTVWRGNLNWSTWRFISLFVILTIPFVWLLALIPKAKLLFKSPIVKFVVYVYSHIFLTTLLVFVTNEKPAERTELFPNYLECVLLIWLSGLLVSELVNPVDRTNIAIFRIIILIFSGAAIIVHISCYFLVSKMISEIIYIRNQILGGATFLCFVVTLDFLSFHHLFGPWTIIIRDLIGDLFKFLVIFVIFLFAFACMLTGTFQAIKEPQRDDIVPDILDIIILLYFCLFGLVNPTDLPNPNLSPSYGDKISKFVFGFALLIIIIVLVNLLIAMMSDTYQRIQAQSDTEWKFGRAKLIRNMKNTTPIPSPFILVFQFCVFVGKLYSKLRSLPIAKLSEDDDDEIVQRMRRKSVIAPNLSVASGDFKYGPDKLEEVVNWSDIARRYLDIRGNSNIFINTEEPLDIPTDKI